MMRKPLTVAGLLDSVETALSNSRAYQSWHTPRLRKTRLRGPNRSTIGNIHLASLTHSAYHLAAEERRLRSRMINSMTSFVQEDIDFDDKPSACYIWTKT